MNVLLLLFLSIRVKLKNRDENRYITVQNKINQYQRYLTALRCVNIQNTKVILSIIQTTQPNFGRF